MIARLKAWALWALFGIGAILFALVKGRRDGRALAQQEQQADVAEDAARLILNHNMVGRQLCGWTGRK